ncbi:MAG: hypothetical protein LBI64_01225 [Coriobacteriales bacterium]|jgi:uncharacterized membrane protein YgcG|nr:hypothetical protein [Coriobacteriales bacterium]
MKRAAQIVMLGLLALVIALPLARSQLDPEGRSDINNAPLPAFPSLENEGSLINQAYSYASDRIGFRPRSILISQALNAGLFSLLTHPLYDMGTDGQFFFRFEPYTTSLEWLTAYADYLKQMQDYCEQRDVTFLFVMTPTKNRVMTEYIPDAINYTRTLVDDFIPLLEERGVNYIDLGAVMLANKDDYPVFYQKFDSWHWSETGAFLGAQAIIERLQEDHPSLEALEFDDYLAEDYHYETLPNSQFAIDETSPLYTLADPSAGAIEVEGLGESLIRIRAYHDLRVFENPNIPDAPRELFFTGSYFNGKDRVSYNQFSYSANVHNYTDVMALPYYYSLFDPDIVIVDTADYVYDSWYFPYEGLLRTQLALPFETWEGLPRERLTPSAALGAPDFSNPDAFCVEDPTGNGLYVPFTVVGPVSLGDGSDDASDGGVGGSGGEGGGSGGVGGSGGGDGAGGPEAFALTPNDGQPVSNYYLTWAGPAIQSAYVQIGEQIYDCCLTGNIIEFGLWTDELVAEGSVTIITIAADGQKAYEVTMPVQH